MKIEIDKERNSQRIPGRPSCLLRVDKQHMKKEKKDKLLEKIKRQQNDRSMKLNFQIVS
jgi:hypothetical protein